MSPVLSDITWLAEYRIAVDNEIASFFTNRYRKTGKTDPERIFEEAMQHAVVGGGKRLRPILSMLSYEIASGRSGTEIMSGAIGLEFMHCYTLVHDDLPSMDNDTLRRGLPTVWKKYGEYIGVLVGDALQALAFESVTSLGNTEVITLFARSLGDLGVIRGQVKDMQPEQYADSIGSLLSLQRQKTGLFIEVSLEIGAILGGADETMKKLFKDYWRSIGLIFQIQDDILDYEGDSPTLGKTIGKDAEQKKGIVGLIGMDEAKQMRARYLEEALISARALNSEKLESLAAFMATRKK